MLEALKARDSARMRKVMMQHVRNKRDVVIQQLDKALIEKAIV
jgi:DNA-binding GntR family transcriptional regulator